MTTLVPPTLPALPRRGVFQAPALACAQTMPKASLAPPIPHRSLVLLLSEELSALHSTLAVSRRAVHNNHQQAPVGCSTSISSITAYLHHLAGPFQLDLLRRLRASKTLNRKPGNVVMVELNEGQDETIRITHVSVNFTPEVGADDSLLAIRIVPDGRDGPVVYGRSLLPGEQDDGSLILLRPSAGERLKFRPLALRFTIADADRQTVPEPDGYRPITNTIWTWLSFGAPTDVRIFRYLLACARRLDGTRVLLVEVARVMEGVNGNFTAVRAQLFRALSTAEILIVALGRTVDLLVGLGKSFSIPVPLPTTLDSKKDIVRERRNAFEHIDDRALGQVRGRPHPDALTVFDQRAFFLEGRLTYAAHSLSLHEDFTHMLRAARQYIWDIAVHFAGDARELDSSIQFFDQPSPGAGAGA
jgi:hypothetical protein